MTPFVAMSLVACGGSSKPAEDASSAKPSAAETQSSATSDTAGQDSAAASKKSDEKSESSNADTGMPKVVRSPKDKLTAPDIVFKFNFKESEVGQKAEKECSESSKGDGAKMAKCMLAAQKRVIVDDYHFKKDESDNWYLLGLRTKGAQVTWTHRIPIDFGNETENTVVVKITGKDKGQTPYKNPPSEITFEVPNDYQIIQKDAEHGTLVFDAKISTLGDGDKKPAR
ncbi:MAG: hypothetical protein QM784_34290 [Polyangiaceae bacterium]